MALLDKLLARLRAVPELGDISVVENESVDVETFHFKIRASVSSATLQVRVLRDESLVRYAYQLFAERPLLRWDNAPHYPDLPNYPHHQHDQENNVSASSLTGDVLVDLEAVLAEIVRLAA